MTVNSQSEFQDGAAGYIQQFLLAATKQHENQTKLCAKLIISLARLAFEPRVDEKTKENARKVLEVAERALQNFRKEAARELAK